MNADRTSDGTEDVIFLGPLKFVVIERRGDLELGYCHDESLPYVVVSTCTIMARTRDRACASWVIDGLEGE